MVAETKIGVILYFKCKYGDKISGGGGEELGWEIDSSWAKWITKKIK